MGNQDWVEPGKIRDWLDFVGMGAMLKGKENVPIAPPRVDSSKGPHRVNRAHWPTKENKQMLYIFCMFSVHRENGLGWPRMGPGGFFPTNPGLADILGRTDVEFENFHFFPTTLVDGFSKLWLRGKGILGVETLIPGISMPSA